MPSKWEGRYYFAEIAEALHVRTDEIMAATTVPSGAEPREADGWLVLYTTDTDELANAVVHRALLRVGYDGTLAVVKRAPVISLLSFLLGLDDGDLDELEARVRETLATIRKEG